MREQSCIDLVAAEEAVYHSACMAEFIFNVVDVRGATGRPSDTGMTESFDDICNWLETSSGLFTTIQEQHEKMQKENNGIGYTVKAFREKLKTRYKEHVYFVEEKGRICELVYFIWQIIS